MRMPRGAADSYAEAEDDPEDEIRARKKRAAANQREWIEYGRWDRSEFSEEDINKRCAR